jgi:hypothetical protein
MRARLRLKAEANLMIGITYQLRISGFMARAGGLSMKKRRNDLLPMLELQVTRCQA